MFSQMSLETSLVNGFKANGTLFHDPISSQASLIRSCSIFSVFFVQGYLVNFNTKFCTKFNISRPRGKGSNTGASEARRFG